MVTMSCSTSSGYPSITGTNVGSYSFTVSLRDTANNQWSDGSITAKTFTLKINPRNVSNTTIASTSAQTYNGSAYKPTPAVTDSEISKTLVNGTDFSYSYENNTNAGTATIKITGKGNYTGTKTSTFTINARNVSNTTIASTSAQNYIGSAIKPTPAVTDSGIDKTLANGTDFTYSYSNNTNVGTATITITGKGNYTGTKTSTFTINARSISNATFGTIGTQTYNKGTAITPTPTITDSGISKTLTNNTDFTFDYSNNKNAGTATIIIKGKGNYTGSKSTTFAINARDISLAAIGDISNYTYDGTEKKPTATVTDGSITLSSTNDFSFSYSNNLKAGTATLTITGKGNYTGTKSKNFTINTRAISAATVAAIASQAYTGSAKTPLPTVTDLSKTLVKDTDYTLDYSNNTSVGTATITITGKGNYSGTKEVTFSITARDISLATIGEISNYTYDGTEHEPTATVKDGSVTLSATNDFDFSYSNNVNAGTATLTITGKGNYAGTKSKSFTITARGISAATVAEIASQPYTGSAKEPKPTVTDLSNTLVLDVDYTLSYTNNINAGTATVTITGKGNYTGTKSKNFTINTRAISTATVEEIAAKTYTGSAITPLPTVSDLSKTLAKDTDYTLKYSNNTSVGTATVTITGKGNYSGTKEVTFSITQRNISNATVAEIEIYYYDGAEKTPEPSVKDGSTTLVEGTDFEYGYRNNVNVGTATLVITGLGNYGGTKEVAFTISPPTIDRATVTLSQIEFTYDGTAKEPSVTLVKIVEITLVEGVDFTVSYSANINAGTAKVILTGKGAYTGTKEVTFTINPADMTSATLVGLNLTYVYTGSAILPTVTVNLDGKELVRNTDYLISFTNNINVGTATVTVTGSKNYTGTLTETFEVIRADIATASVTGINATYEYTSAAITPEPTVIFNGVTLVKDTDYTLTYSANTALGIATVTITGLGNFEGTANKTFEIVKANISSATVTGIEASYEFTGSDIEPEPSLTLKGVDLVKDTDFTVTYSNNLNEGTATVTITGCGNYEGEITKNFVIGKADISSATVTGINASYEFTGSAITPEPTLTFNGITLVKDTDYTVSYSANTNLGTATITFTGAGNFEGTSTKTFEIVAADISSATVTGINANYGFTGSEIKPEPTVTLNDKTLVKDTDFTVTYSNNLNVGTATVTITGAGNYTGEITKNFTVGKADISSATVTSIEESYGKTGVAIEPVPTVTLNDITLVKDTDFTVTYSSNTSIGTAHYTITGIGNYEGSIEGTFEIVKAKPSVTVSYPHYDADNDTLYAGKPLPEISATATFNGVNVAGNISWKQEDGNAPTLKNGERAYGWIFTPDDTDNYEAVEGSENLTAEIPSYTAISAEWKNGTQPELFTSSSVTVIKQNLKVTGYFTSGDSDEILGGYSFAGSWDDTGAANTVKMPSRGGNDFFITVYFGELNSVILSVEIKDVVLTEIIANATVTDYTALDKFDTSSVTATAKYNDGAEKSLSYGKGGYTVVYENGDCLQYGDSKVTFSYTDNGVTKTAEVGVSVSRKPYEGTLSLNPDDMDYNFGNPLTGGIAVEDLPEGVTKVDYVYAVKEGDEWKVIPEEEVKDAGNYKVTANFTVDNNHEGIDPVTGYFEILKIEPKLTPAVGGNLSAGTSLSELNFSAGDSAVTGTLTWDDSAYELKEGINRCYYTFTPDDTKNFKVLHGYVDVAAEAPKVADTSGGLIGWQIVLIIVAVVVAVIAIVALALALKLRRAADEDGFYDDATEEQLTA